MKVDTWKYRVKIFTWSTYEACFDPLSVQCLNTYRSVGHIMTFLISLLRNEVVTNIPLVGHFIGLTQPALLLVSLPHDHWEVSQNKEVSLKQPEPLRIQDHLGFSQNHLGFRIKLGSQPSLKSQQTTDGKKTSDNEVQQNSPLVPLTFCHINLFTVRGYINTSS